AATWKVGLPSLSRYLPFSDLAAVGSPGSSAKACPDATSMIAATINRMVRKAFSSKFGDRTSRRGTRSAPGRLLAFLLRQCEHRQRAAERGVVAQRRITADCAKPRGRIGQARSQPDAGPAADPGQYRNILPAALLIGRDVADDARRGLELVKLLARLGIDRLQVAFQRAVEHHSTGGRQRS